MSLKTKMEDVASAIADALLDPGVALSERIAGLKTLSLFYATMKRADAGDRGNGSAGKWGELRSSFQIEGEGEDGETDAP